MNMCHLENSIDQMCKRSPKHIKAKAAHKHAFDTTVLEKCSNIFGLCI